MHVYGTGVFSIASPCTLKVPLFVIYLHVVPHNFWLLLHVAYYLYYIIVNCVLLLWAMAKARARARTRARGKARFRYNTITIVYN